ncbi:MAG: phosphate ABC transporter substrate-binding/OmpA family protein [Paracoccaceae bacterium]
MRILLALLLTCAAPAWAESARVTMPGGLVLEGRAVGFDGTYLRLLTEAGEVTVTYEGATCEGACPDPAAYVPTLRLAGAERLADLLLPALVEGYARERGLAALREDHGAGRFTYRLTAQAGEGAPAPDPLGGAARAAATGPEGGAGDPTLDLTFHATTTDAGFAALLSYEADAVMSVRPARAAEQRAVREAGLGDLAAPGRARIVALDALVPVVSVANPTRAVSMEGLRALARGAWPDGAPVALHLPPEASGLTQEFAERVLGGALPEATHHDDVGALLTAVSVDPLALGIVPWGRTDFAAPVALVDGCGRGPAADAAGLRTGDYPLSVPLYLYLPERRLDPAVAAFLDWLRGVEAHRIVRRAGLVDQDATPIPLAAQGERLAAAIAEAGPEVRLRDLQAMLARLDGLERLSPTFRFVPGEARLTARSQADARLLARLIQDGDLTGPLLLAGFSDGAGPAPRNAELSLERARVVRSLVTRMLGGALPPGTLIAVEGYGEALPMGCDATATGRATNRRVELWAPAAAD